MSEQAVESCELGLSVCSAAHAAEVGDCEAVCFSLFQVGNARYLPRQHNLIRASNAELLHCRIFDYCLGVEKPTSGNVSIHENSFESRHMRFFKVSHCM